MEYEQLTEEFIEIISEFNKVKHKKNVDFVMDGELSFLYHISRKQDGVLPKEISDNFGISSARVANVLNDLEDKGFITRQIDKIDRRKIIVKLTDEGNRAGKEQLQKFLEKMTVLFSLLGEKDAREYVRITGKLAGIIANIESDCLI